MRARTLRTQLLGVVIAALLPLLGIAIWQGWIVLQDSRDLVTTRLRANAWGVAELQRDPFIIAQHALTFAAQQPEVRTMGPRCKAILASALQGSGALVNLLRTDASGRARCSVMPFRAGQDLSRDDWWLARGERRTLYLAPPQFGQISQRRLQLMVLPLFSPTNEFMGTISAGIGIEALGASLRQQEHSRPGAIMVVDARGRPIIKSPRAQIARFDQVIAARSDPQTVVATDHRPWTYVSAPLYRDELFVVYTEPARSVTQAALSRMWPSLLLPLVALLLTSLAIWIASQRLILRWLDDLRLMTARFARGDFRGELERYARAPIEFAEFAAHLHHMARAIEAQERGLRDALAAKTALTKEVNHRVKNNLQIVNSLLTLQSDRVTDPEGSSALRQARTRIAALGLIHRLLYEGDGGDEQGSVSIDRLVRDLCSQLRSSHRHRPQVELECSSQLLLLSADQAVPLTLFIVEAVTNAFAHGFDGSERGSIRVDVETHGTDGVIRVTDDGRGFAIADAPSSMGIDLIRAFAEQVSGTVRIESGAAGTMLTLTFPLRSEASTQPDAQ